MSEWTWTPGLARDALACDDVELDRSGRCRAVPFEEQLAPLTTEVTADEEHSGGTVGRPPVPAWYVRLPEREVDTRRVDDDVLRCDSVVGDDRVVIRPPAPCLVDLHARSKSRRMSRYFTAASAFGSGLGVYSAIVSSWTGVESKSNIDGTDDKRRVREQRDRRVRENRIERGRVKLGDAGRSPPCDTSDVRRDETGNVLAESLDPLRPPGSR